MSEDPFTAKYLAGQVLLVDKPLEWTSFDVVKKIRGTLRIKKIGHAGTLDPLATGLLILCTGKMTKQIETYQGQEKEYTGTLVLGKTTPSLDLETEFDSGVSTDHLTPTDVETVRERFIGAQQQIPPHYSAIRVDGKRAYKDAHKGKTVKMEPRLVDITELEFTRIEIPEVDFRVVCSKGTYIRALA
ncbi:MAG TPA: tRNA pseudouridine(55) synthase TruB, partial [Cytophagales bacterium]|nr:tRNA pseudouridine(55) synthase TruB [Cytophagales bacterium]